MKVLAIRLGRFGDIVLLLPALALLKARLPDTHLALLTDTRWGPLAAMCPAIDEVITVDRIRMRDGSSWNALMEIRRLVADLRRRHFDAVIDCHGFRETNLLAWWSGASQRWGLKRADQSFLSFCFNRPWVIEDKSLHASESFVRLVEKFAPDPTSAVPATPLLIPADALHWADENLPAVPFIVLFVDAPVPERKWPLDRFVSAAIQIKETFKCESVVVGGRDQSLTLFPPAVRVFSELSIPRLAAIVGKARMLVSNDTGPMHLGPLLGVPTVGIFSVGIPTHFRPTGPVDRYVRGNPIETVTLDDVMKVVNQVWESTDRRDPRC